MSRALVTSAPARAALVALALVAVTGCGAHHGGPRPLASSLAPCDGQTIFGTIVSLGHGSVGYRLRVNPAVLTWGLTAAVAARERHGGTGDDGYFVVDDSSRTLLYAVAAAARVVVVDGIHPDGVSVDLPRFMRAMDGRVPLRHIAPLLYGGWWWLRTGRTGAICSLRQQYFP